MLFKIMLAIAVTASAVSTEPAGAEPASTAPPILTLQKTALFHLDEDSGTVRTEEEQTRLSETVSGDTRVVKTWLSGPAPMASSANGSCSLVGDTKNTISFPPQRVGVDEHSVSLHWIYFLHLKNKAVKRNTDQFKQLQMCGAGGSKVFDGFRTRTAGTTMTYRAQPLRIDGKNAVGRDQTKLSTTLGFKLGPENGPLRVDASMTITGGGRNHGGPGRTDVPTPEDAFFYNQWHGLWDSDCVLEMTIFCGSHDFEGTLVHDLWEFDEKLPLDEKPASATAFVTYSCGKLFGVGCGMY